VNSASRLEELRSRRATLERGPLDQAALAELDALDDEFYRLLGDACRPLKRRVLFKAPLPEAEGDAFLASARQDSPLALAFLRLWYARRLPRFREVLVAHRREADPSLVGHCEEYARAFREDVRVAGPGATVEVFSADVGLEDRHWWCEWRGEALDVALYEQSGPCPTVEPVAAFRALRRVVAATVVRESVLAAPAS
jgi:hypothetical protein